MHLLLSLHILLLLDSKIMTIKISSKSKFNEIFNNLNLGYAYFCYTILNQI